MLKRPLKESEMIPNPSRLLTSLAPNQRKIQRSSPWDTPPVATNEYFRISRTKAKKKILALDLDETLINCKTEICVEGMTQIRFQSNGVESQLNVTIRPDLEEFLESMSRIYTLVIYTIDSKEYAEALLKALDINKYISATLHRGHCKISERNILTKCLSVLGVPLSDTILIDDSLIHFENQPNNVLIKEPFLGDPSDRELSRIKPFLMKLAKDEDIRPVYQKYDQYNKIRKPSQSVSEKYMTSNKVVIPSILKNPLAKKKLKRVSFETDSFFQNNFETKSQESKYSQDDFEEDDDLNENLNLNRIPQVVGENAPLFQIIKSKIS